MKTKHAKMILSATATDGRCVHSIRIALSYHQSDPWAVLVAFEEDDTRTTWEMSRELLTAALEVREGAGMGAVEVYRVNDGSQVELLLRGDGDECYVEFSTGMLAEFLAQTYRIVPMGKESEYVDLDREIQQHIMG